MSGIGRRIRWRSALVGAGLALLCAGCARTDSAETSASAVAESLMSQEAAELFGAAEPAAGAAAPGLIPPPPLRLDPAQVPNREAPPPTASPLADL